MEHGAHVHTCTESMAKTEPHLRFSCDALPSSTGRLVLFYLLPLQTHTNTHCLRVDDCQEKTAVFPAVLGNAAARFTKAAMMTYRRGANAAKAPLGTLATQHKKTAAWRDCAS